MESAETEANNQMMNDQIVASSSNHHDKNLNMDNGFVEPTETISTAKLNPERPLSPYPNVRIEDLAFHYFDCTSIC